MLYMTLHTSKVVPWAGLLSRFSCVGPVKSEVSVVIGTNVCHFLLLSSSRRALLKLFTENILGGHADFNIIVTSSRFGTHLQMARLLVRLAVHWHLGWQPIDPRWRRVTDVYHLSAGRVSTNGATDTQSVDCEAMQLRTPGLAKIPAWAN